MSESAATPSFEPTCGSKEVRLCLPQPNPSQAKRVRNQTKGPKRCPAGVLTNRLEVEMAYAEHSHRWGSPWGTLIPRENPNRPIRGGVSLVLLQRSKRDVDLAAC
jgi:hypothetical protein